MTSVWTLVVRTGFSDGVAVLRSQLVAREAVSKTPFTFPGGRRSQRISIDELLANALGRIR